MFLQLQCVLNILYMTQSCQNTGVHCSCKHSHWLESLLVCPCKVSLEPANSWSSFPRHEEHAFQCQAAAAPVSLRKQHYEDVCKICVNTAIWFHAPLFSQPVSTRAHPAPLLMFCHCAERKQQDELPLWYSSSHVTGRLNARRGTLRAPFIHCVCFVLSFGSLIDLSMVFRRTHSRRAILGRVCACLCVHITH